MSDRKSRAFEIRVGLLVIITLLLVIVGSLWIVGSFPLGEETTQYRVWMKNSGGVQEGDQVRVAGVESGRVESLELLPGDEWPVRFRVSLDSDIAVHQGAGARIASEGLLGSNFLEIDVGRADREPLPPDEPIRGSPSGSLDDVLAGAGGLTERAVALLDQLGTTVTSVTEQVEPLLQRLARLMSDENLEAISGTLGSMQSLMVETQPRVDRLLGELETLVGSFNEGAETLPDLTADARGLVGDLRRALGPDGARLAHLLESAQGSLDSAGSTFGLLEDNRRELETTLRDLQLTIANLKAFSQTVKERPSSLVRKHRLPDRKPGEGVR